MEDGDSRKNRFIKLFSKKQTDEDKYEKEIISMVKEGHEQGALLESEARMIHNIFEFGDKEAKDIMTHRKHIVALDGNMVFSEAMKYIIDQKYSRFPVYSEDIDNLIGAIHIREVLMYAKNPAVQNIPIKDIDELVFAVDFIPETKNINALFKEMQVKKNHIVIVVDEYGQTSGLVALEDILEEIVGNILDEHDEEEKTIILTDEDTYLMQGMTSLEDAEIALGIKLTDEDYETLNGYLISLIGKIPDEDDTITVSDEWCQYDILSVNNKMIGAVRVKRLTQSQSNHGADLSS